MQRMEVCISFAPKIPRIPVVVPGRLLVREGEAQLVEKKGKTKASSIHTVIHPFYNSAMRLHTPILHTLMFPYTHSTYPHVSIHPFYMPSCFDTPILRSPHSAQVWVILFTDILLITQRRRGTVLMCLEPAIPLDSLRVNDFNCSGGIEYCNFSNEHTV